MTRHVPRLVAAISVAASLLLPASSASAHGTCVFTLTPREPLKATGRMDCGSTSHQDYYVRVCWEWSNDPLGLSGWSNPQDWWTNSPNDNPAYHCRENSWAGPGYAFEITHAYDPESYGECTPRFWRAYGVGSAGNGGAHWGMYAYTPVSLYTCP